MARVKSTRSGAFPGSLALALKQKTTRRRSAPNDIRATQLSGTVEIPHAANLASYFMPRELCNVLEFHEKIAPGFGHGASIHRT